MKNKLKHLFKNNIFLNLEYSQSNNQFEYFRIFIALFSIINFLLFWLDYKIFLLPTGLITWEVTNANSFWFEPHFMKMSAYLNISSVYILYIFSFLYITSLGFLALGIATKLFSVSSFLLFLLFSVQLYPFLYGVDLYQSLFLLFLCAFPSGYSLSLVHRTKTEKIANKQQIGVRGIQLYLALTYLSAGYGKLQMDSWFNGEFLFLSLQDPNYHLLSFPETLHYYFYLIAGIVVVFCEACYFILIFIPFARTIAVAIIITMHIFISLFMGLFPFGLLLILVNLIAWYPFIFIDINIIYNLIKPQEDKKYEQIT